MPTVKDLVDEVQTLASEMSERIDTSDKEQKKRGEDLTSKTAAIAAELKTSTDRVKPAHQ